MKGAIIIIACLCLSACSDWPDVPSTPGAERADDWPTLVPLEEVSRIRSAGDASDRQALSARAAGLNARASILRRPIASIDDMERLRALMVR